MTEPARASAEWLLQIAERISEGIALPEVLDFTYDHLKGHIPFDRIGLALLDEAGEQVEAAWSRGGQGPGSIVAGYRMPLADTSLGFVLATRRPRVLNDLALYLDLKPHSDATRRLVDEGIRASLTCPLYARSGPIGFLFFSAREAGAYTAAHGALFDRLARLIALAVEKAVLHDRLDQARASADRLIASLLPADMVERVRAGERQIADAYEDVGVLFADLVDSTGLSTRVSPRDLVATLDEVFALLDGIAR